MRYIDADELMEKIKKCEFNITGCGIMYDAGGVQSAINTQRAADVSPRAEIAEQIFAEIYSYLTPFPNRCALISLDALAELKKKYTGDQT